MKDFKKYAEQAREDFTYEVSKYTVENNLALRTKADSLLIAFDQAVAKALIIDGVVVPKGTLVCGKENKTCEYLKSDNKCGLRKRWCTYQAK